MTKSILKSIYSICTGQAPAVIDTSSNIDKSSNRAAANMGSNAERRKVLGNAGATIQARLTAQERILATAFRGSRLTLRSKRGAAADLVAKDLKEGMASAAGALRGGAKMTFENAKGGMEQFISAMGIPADVLDIVNGAMLEAGNASLEEAFKGALPFVGLCFGLLEAKNCGQAVRDDLGFIGSAERHGNFALPGTPAAAVQALRAVLEKELAFDSVDAARSGAVVGTQIAGLFLDLGTVSNLGVAGANLVAKFLLNFGRLAVIGNEILVGNQILEAPETLNLEVFEKCPILGCYYLQAANAIDLVDIYFEADGKGNGPEMLKQAKDHMGPIKELVNGYIERSNIQLSVAPASSSHASNTFVIPRLTRTTGFGV